MRIYEEIFQVPHQPIAAYPHQIRMVNNLTQFNQSANGTEVELSVGQEFELVLPETRTAGYRWTLTSNGAPTCSLLKESAEPSTGAAGGSGTHTWYFRAGSAGSCTLASEYKRTWEAGSEPAQTFTMKVRVRP